MVDPAKYSSKNLIKIVKTMKVVLDEFEIRGKETRIGIEITPKQLESSNLYKDGFVAILRELNKSGIGSFRIYNDLPNFSRMNIGDKNNVFFKIIDAKFIGNFRKKYVFLKRTLETHKKDQSQIVEKPKDWGWLNKKEGEYQFSKKIFQQKGEKRRKKIFQALMDVFEKSPQAISVDNLREMTGLTGKIIRIEISAINKRLVKAIGIRFVGTGKGYYILKSLKSSS